MKHTRDLFWILLVNGIYNLNTSYKTGVNDTSSMSLLLNFQTFHTLCDPATNISTMRTLNSSTVANDNTLCAVNSSEPTEKAIDFDAKNKIEYYHFLQTKIWTILPPILLGKK